MTSLWLKQSFWTRKALPESIHGVNKITRFPWHSESLLPSSVELNCSSPLNLKLLERILASLTVVTTLTHSDSCLNIFVLDSPVLYGSAHSSSFALGQSNIQCNYLLNQTIFVIGGPSPRALVELFWFLGDANGHWSWEQRLNGSRVRKCFFFFFLNGNWHCEP